MTKTLINLFGGPNIGKSTVAYGLTYMFKRDQYNAELVTEFAKELVYENRIEALSSSPYIYGEQYKRMKCVSKHADIIITDCPFILTTIYYPKNESGRRSFTRHVINQFKSFSKKYKTINIVLVRDPNKKFIQSGRIHNKEESLEIDKKIVHLLEKNSIPFITLTSNADSIYKEISWTI